MATLLSERSSGGRNPHAFHRSYRSNRRAGRAKASAPVSGRASRHGGMGGTASTPFTFCPLLGFFGARPCAEQANGNKKIKAIPPSPLGRAHSIALRPAIRKHIAQAGEKSSSFLVRSRWPNNPLSVPVRLICSLNPVWMEFRQLSEHPATTIAMGE